MNLEDDERLALSNAVLHALGCVATKIGFVVIFSGSREMWPGSDRLRAIYFSSRAVVARIIDQFSGQLFNRLVLSS